MSSSSTEDMTNSGSSNAHPSQHDSPRLGYSPPKRYKTTRLCSLGRWAEHPSQSLASQCGLVKLSNGATLHSDDLVPRYKRSSVANDVVCLWQGDITTLQIDGIVNAANDGLWAGGGICGAIHGAAGPQLAKECSRIGKPPVRCPTGETVITRGYNLPAKFVLHTVGPTKEDPGQLQSSYNTTLDLAAVHGLKSIALCCVSTGIFGFPLRRATHLALNTVREWLDANADVLQTIVFTVFTETEFEMYESLLPCYFPRSSDREIESNAMIPPVPLSPRRPGSGRKTLKRKCPCRYGNDCRTIRDSAHCAKYSHPGMDDFSDGDFSLSPRMCQDSDCDVWSPRSHPQYTHRSESIDSSKRMVNKKPLCKYGLECRFMNDLQHRQLYLHSIVHGDPDIFSDDEETIPPPPMVHPSAAFLRPCKYGKDCREMHVPSHCQRYAHPGQEASRLSQLTPCRFGIGCKMKSDTLHIQKFSHPTQDIGLLTPCRHGEECREKHDAFHCAKYSHPGQESMEGLSREEDHHIGTKYPRVRCKNHPGCPKRRTCWYSHGLIHSVASSVTSAVESFTCFLSQPPHNQACTKPTQSGEPFDFCSGECKAKARRTPKGKLGCRRENCPCPCTINGAEGQFCCDVCAHGKPCNEPVHTCPSSHLVAVARPQKNRYASCARHGCACAHGSSWNGKPGQYCCRACRNGTPCTKLWHTVPEVVALASREQTYRGNECALEGCIRATWNGRAGEYCCVEHRRADRNRKSSCASVDVTVDMSLPDVALRLLRPAPQFPDFAVLFRNAESWVKASSGSSSKGAVAAVWQNMSLLLETCPARISFERAVAAAKLDKWEDGEFGWHGTKSLAAVQDICWASWDTKRRSGQACGPGEYFSRAAGITYSQGYAGGDAGNLLIVAWIMSHRLGAAPANAAANGAGSPGGAHLVCNNPVTSGNVSTGAMYCIPIAVVAFGSASPQPSFQVK